MDRDGWATIKVVCELPRLKELHTTMGDIRLIVNGEGGNRKRRFELRSDHRCIRRAQGHSFGNGVRPDILPVAGEMRYLIHGASLQAEKNIASGGLSRCRRLHIHFYECDRRGIAVGGKPLRSGSEVGIVALSPHCVDGGISIFRPQRSDAN